MQIGILNLPETSDVIDSSSFIIYSFPNTVVTKRLLFNSIQLGLENTTLTPTITSHAQGIVYLYNNLYSLSAQSSYLNNSLNDLINSTITNAFKDLTQVLFPLSCIKCTSNNINPGYYIPNTNWISVNHGKLIAGVTNNQVPYIDKNGDFVTIAPRASNFNLGEYSNILTISTIPQHAHTAQIKADAENTAVGGLDVESAGGNPITPGTETDPVISLTTGESEVHNNVPPLYGLYFWMRVDINQGTYVETVAPVTLPNSTPTTPVQRDLNRFVTPRVPLSIILPLIPSTTVFTEPNLKKDVILNEEKDVPKVKTKVVVKQSPVITLEDQIEEEIRRRRGNIPTTTTNIDTRIASRSPQPDDVVVVLNGNIISNTGGTGPGVVLPFSPRLPFSPFTGIQLPIGSISINNEPIFIENRATSIFGRQPFIEELY